MNIFAVFYTHKHGHDHYAFLNEDDAHSCAKKDDAHSCAKKIAVDNLSHFSEEKLSGEEAFSDWYEITQGEENIEIVSLNCHKSFEESPNANKNESSHVIYDSLF